MYKQFSPFFLFSVLSFYFAVNFIWFSAYVVAVGQSWINSSFSISLVSAYIVFCSFYFRLFSACKQWRCIAMQQSHSDTAGKKGPYFNQSQPNQFHISHTSHALSSLTSDIYICCMAVKMHEMQYTSHPLKLIDWHFNNSLWIKCHDNTEEEKLA